MCTKKKLASFLLLFGLTNSSLFCMYGQGMGMSMGKNKFMYANTEAARKMANIEEKRVQIEAFRAALLAFEDLKKTLGQGIQLEKTPEEQAACVAQMKLLDAQSQKYVSTMLELLTKQGDVSDPWGMLIARSLAGPNNGAVLDGVEVSDWLDGAKKGGATLMISAFSESLRGKAKALSDESVGSAIDFFIAKLKDFFGMVRNVLFHDCNSPFDFAKLDGWEKIILASFDDILEMLKNVSRDSSRGLDSVSRQFDDNNAEEPDNREIDMWASLAGGYAYQFAYFISVFEQHKEYYDKDDIVVFYANQICQMLEATRKLLLSSKSLKDLDSKLESQKAMIPAYKKNIFNLFEQLKTEVKPKTYSSSSSSTSSSSTYKPNSYNSYSSYTGSGNYNYGSSDYPTSYSAYSGL